MGLQWGSKVKRKRRSVENPENSVDSISIPPFFTHTGQHNTTTEDCDGRNGRECVCACASMDGQTDSVVHKLESESDSTSKHTHFTRTPQCK